MPNTRTALAHVFESLYSQRQGTSHSVLLIDIDQLHVINEIHGYETGDELILRLAQLLSPPRLPSNALTARLSGDRFIVVLPETNTQTASEVAAQLQQAIQSVPVGQSNRRIEATLSCGITAVSEAAGGFTRALNLGPSIGQPQGVRGV